MTTRTHPLGFVSGTSLPCRAASATAEGTSASLSAVRARRSAANSSSSMTRRCSFVHPDGPETIAEPFLASHGLNQPLSPQDKAAA